MKKLIEICRFCLENDDNMYDMFADNSKDQYILKITEITGSAEPKEFSIACFNCLRLLEICWKFRIQAQSSHDFLKKILFNANTLDETVSQSSVASDGFQKKSPEKRNKTDTNWDLAIEPIKTGLNDLVPIDNQIQSKPNKDTITVEDSEIIELHQTVDRSSIDEENNSIIDFDTPLQNQTSTEMIDESTNDETLGYNEEEPEFSDFEIKAQSETTTQNLKKMARQITRAVKTKLKNNIFACNICNRTFTQAGNLYTHKLTHSGIREHTCNICGKQFKFSSHLKNHQFTHQERRFSCDICQAKFHKHSYLKTHQRQHSGEKPYSCECGKSFNNISNYKSHQRIHTGEKNYACDNCGKRFSQSSSCLRHIKKSCNKNFMETKQDKY